MGPQVKASEGDAMLTQIRETLRVGQRGYTFSLWRKPAQMGSVPIDHWWMKTTELYGQRAQREQGRGNLETVANYFWALCKEAGSTTEIPVRQSFLLTKILPFTRNQGSRRVLTDSYLRRPDTRRQKAGPERLRELDDLIQNSRLKSITPEEFEEKTQLILGPARPDTGLRQAYSDFCAEFFGGVQDLLLRDECRAVNQTLTAWQKWMRSVGRRAGNAAQKQVLDIISYECRAALHRCYSAVWCNLIPHLQNKYQFSQETHDFLALWHLDQVRELGREAPAYWHLFHGHVFALHPATAEFLRTPSGQDLMGNWLKKPGDQTYGRLLHGILIAVYVYAEQRETIAADRRKKPAFAGHEFLEQGRRPSVNRAMKRRKKSS